MSVIDKEPGIGIGLKRPDRSGQPASAAKRMRRALPSTTVGAQTVPAGTYSGSPASTLTSTVDDTTGEVDAADALKVPDVAIGLLV